MVLRNCFKVKQFLKKIVEISFSSLVALLCSSVSHQMLHKKKKSFYYLFLNLLIFSHFNLFRIFAADISSLVNNASATDDLSNAPQHIKSKIRSEFDWRAYLEIYQDIAKHFSTREEALFHFLKFGRKEGRRFPKIFPNQPGLGIAHKKLTKFLRIMEANNIPIEERTFIIYYVDQLDIKNSLEVAVNNVKIFNSSIMHDYLLFSDNNGDESSSGKERISKNFYWFNIIGGVDNVLRPYLPLTLSNVAEVEWLLSPGDMFMHFRTLGLFKHTIETKFGSTVFTNQQVRGPLKADKAGKWIDEYRSLLFSPGNNIGLLGPTLSCEYAPHIQTHLFMIRNSLIPAILAEYTTFRKFDDSISLQKRYNLGLTEVVQRNGWNVSSFLAAKRYNKPVFDGYCLTKPKDAVSSDPTQWCNIAVEDVLFYKWGGDLLKIGM
jgi:hypothetical protein